MTDQEAKQAEQEARIFKLEETIKKLEAGIAYLVRRKVEDDKEFLGLLRKVIANKVTPEGKIKIF